MPNIQLIIEIPGNEFGIDINDKFQDFFSRLKVEIREHLANNTNLVCGSYELETIDMFLTAFNNSTLLPEGHGRILDEKDILDTENNGGDWYDLYDMPAYIVGVKAIVEADKG